MKYLFITLSIPLVMFSCQNKDADKTQREQELKGQADSITAVAQQVLTF